MGKCSDLTFAGRLVAMTQEEELAAPGRAENAALKSELRACCASTVEQLSGALHAAQARIAELKPRKHLPAAFVKANVARAA